MVIKISCKFVVGFVVILRAMPNQEVVVFRVMFTSGGTILMGH